MKTALFLLPLLLLAQPQEKEKKEKEDKAQSRLPKEPIYGWKYIRKDIRKDPVAKTEVEEITAIIEGREAIPVSTDPGKEIFNLSGVKARYFTEPRRKDEKSREIRIQSERGRYDHGGRTLKLDDNVHVVKLRGEDEPPGPDTILDTPSALLRFNLMYECPTCKMILPAPGRCPDHGVPLKEITVTSVETDREFVLTSSEGMLTGEGLVTDDALRREYHIAKNGFVELSGSPGLAGAPAKKAAVVPAARFTQIASRGPLRITGDEDHRVVAAKDRVRMDRIDPGGTMTVFAEDLKIATVRLPGTASGDAGHLDIRSVDAKGDVRLDGATFADRNTFEASSDALIWDHQVLDDAEIDVAVLTSATPGGVKLKSASSTIDSRRVVIDRLGGRSDFDEVTDSNLAAGTDHFQLQCRTLVTHAGPGATGTTELKSLEARGQVVLGGLMQKEGDPPGKAESDAFDWDTVTRHGRLEATPWVRITQGQSLIIAPKVILESADIMVLKGPKQVRLIQQEKQPPETYRVTCEGDLVLDRATHWLRLRNACVIHSADLLLHADRVDLALTQDNKSMESMLAVGRVDALRFADHTTLYGERLAYRFSDQDLKVYGNPFTVADTGRSVATQERILVYQKPNSRTGMPVRYTEMIGGSSGVLIEIEERQTTAKRPEEKEKKPEPRHTEPPLKHHIEKPK